MPKKITIKALNRENDLDAGAGSSNLRYPGASAFAVCKSAMNVVPIFIKAF